MQLSELVDILDAMGPKLLTQAHLTKRLVGVRFDHAALTPYLSWKPNGYTRNGVHRTAHYEIIVMAWDAGSKSPVHGHSDQTCWLCVHQGRLRIESYAPTQDADRGRVGDGIVLRLADIAQLGPGDTEQDMAGLDVHRVANAGSRNERAISVHIYARPFDSCIAYDLTNHKAFLRKLSYSTVGPPIPRG